jgi:hypothetical protein
VGIRSVSARVAKYRRCRMKIGLHRFESEHEKSNDMANGFQIKKDSLPSVGLRKNHEKQRRHQ